MQHKKITRLFYHKDVHLNTDDLGGAKNVLIYQLFVILFFSYKFTLGTFTCRAQKKRTILYYHFSRQLSFLYNLMGIINSFFLLSETQSNSSQFPFLRSFQLLFSRIIGTSKINWICPSECLFSRIQQCFLYYK